LVAIEEAEEVEEEVEVVEEEVEMVASEAIYEPINFDDQLIVYSWDQLHQLMEADGQGVVEYVEHSEATSFASESSEEEEEE